ncbi:MAG: FAS1-like dehydratase domain-containing protein [Actinomycetota bacterium]
MSTLLTDEIRSWIGREVTYRAPEEVGRASIRYFALAIGDDNPLYTDDDFARAHGYPSVIAPPTMVCETSQYLTRSRPDIGHVWDLPVEGCRMIRGGNEYSFYQPVVPTDAVTARWRIDEIKERTSSSGEPMLIVTSQAEYTNQSGERLALNRETIIYQRIGAPR